LVDAEGKKQGMFRLKDELWATAFDPYFPHYSKQRLEKAYENYIEQFKNKVYLSLPFSPFFLLGAHVPLPCFYYKEPRLVQGHSHRLPSFPSHLRCV
jgi:hypothetical protein